MLVLVPQQGQRSPPSQSPVAVGRVPRGQAASGTRLFSAPARDEGGLGVTFPICGILPYSGHVGAQQEQVSHGRPHFLPFIVKVSTKPLPGPWRARLRPPELPAWPWPLVFSFHSHYLWGHLKGSNWSPMEFHPVSDEMAHEQHLSLVPHGDHVALWSLPGLCAGVAPQNSTQGAKHGPKAARKAGVCDPGSDDQELICADLLPWFAPALTLHTGSIRGLLIPVVWGDLSGEQSKAMALRRRQGTE